MPDDLLGELAENEVDIYAYFEVLRIQADHAHSTQRYAGESSANPPHVRHCLVVICSNRNHISWLTFERDLCDGPKSDVAIRTDTSVICASL